MKKMIAPIIVLFVLLASCQQADKPVASSSPEKDTVIQSNNIRHHLIRVATEITKNSLKGIQTREDLENRREKDYKDFLEMISLTDVPMTGERSPLNIKYTGTIQKEGYRIEKLYYESLPGLYVPANLYVPDNITSPGAAILYLNGHSRTQNHHYQAHPRKFAELGFVCLIVETIQWGEVYGEHWGAYSRGWFNWYSRGYTPAGVEVWNAIRGLDLLAGLEEVDPEKMGVTGISGGGAIGWFTAAADPRVKAVSPVCGNSTVQSHVTARTVDGHCDCMMILNNKGWDFQNIGTLIAPRPLLIAQSDRVGMNTIESSWEVFHDIEKIYDMYGAADNISMVETPGGHSYHQISREAIFSFFTKHLLGKDIPGAELGDIDDSEGAMLTVEELRVYVDGPPADDRTKIIQDSFVMPASPPVISSAEELVAHRDKVKDFLLENTFHAFPDEPVDFEPKHEFRALDGAPYGTDIYSFVTEQDWRLRMEILWRHPKNEKKPLMIVLRSPGEKRWESEGFVSRLNPNWNVAFFEVRGTGETGWAPELQWHVRRASAWAGRTIASMRTYDVLRALEFVREMDNVDASQTGIAARGEMTVPAMYAALLDGRVQTLLLQTPPATQDIAGTPDGRGEALEMLSCLRITDVWQLPALVAPTKVVVVGVLPDSYQWAEKMRNVLGQKGLIVVEKVEDMQ